MSNVPNIREELASGQSSNTNATEQDTVPPPLKSALRKRISIRRSGGSKILTFVTDDDSPEPPPDEGDEEQEEKKKSSLFDKWFKSQKEEKSDAPREISRDYLDRVLYAEGYNLRGEPMHELLDGDLTQNVLEYMYLAVAYTIDNYFGIPGPTSDPPHKLSALLTRLIPDAKRTLKLRKTLPPPYVLTLTVIEATGLIATDANGLSDPFCKVYLNDRVSEAELTEVRELTLSPVWNQTFRFHLRDFRRDVVTVEIWDSDPVGIAANLEQIRQVKSIRGCWFFCQDFFESLFACGRGSIDDFIGQNQLEVGKLYAEGVDKWLPLQTEKGKEAQGELHIAARVEVVRPRNTADALKRHFVLVRLCLEYGIKLSRDSENRISKWDQVLNQSLKTLLYQHAVQGSIQVFEDLICKFVVVVHFAERGVAFDFRFIFAIMTETKESVDQYHTIENVFDASLQDVYHQAVLQLQGLCLSIVKELHTFDIVGDADKRTEVEFVLRCVDLCQCVMGSTSELWPILRLDAESWFMEQAEQIRKMPQENRADRTVKFLQTLKKYLMALDRVIKNVFPNMSYTSVTHKSLEGILAGPLKLQVTQVSNESLNSAADTQTKKKEEAVQLFSTLKQVSDYVSRTLSVPASSTELGQFHAWFGLSTIRDWFSWKEEVVTAQIEFIAKEDDLENKMIEVGGRYEKQSLSVKKASDLIQKELCGLWNLVSGYSDCKTFFVYSLHSCCMRYATTLLDLINTKGLAETFEVGGGRKQVCAIANDLWSMAMFAAHTVARTVARLRRNHPYTKFCLQLLCVLLCRAMSEEVMGEVLSRIGKVADANTRLKQEQALRDYTWYMQKVYRTEANRDLCLEAYILYQDFVWVRVLEEVSRLKDENKKRRETCLDKIRWYWGSACSKLEGLQKLLRETEKLNYYDQNGKLRPVKWNEDFRGLKTELDQLVELNR